MPYYDFVCPKCGTKFEVNVAPDEKLFPCPDCRRPAERQPCAPAFVIKGEHQ